jgi:hypothetical protein
MLRLATTLTDADRDAFIRSFEHAVTNIPHIQRATVGRRVTFGAAYEQGMADYDYMATLEFATEDDLRSYLAHPAHAELGARLFASAEAVLVYDFDAMPGDRVRSLV